MRIRLYHVVAASALLMLFLQVADMIDRKQVPKDFFMSTSTYAASGKETPVDEFISDELEQIENLSESELDDIPLEEEKSGLTLTPRAERIQASGQIFSEAELEILSRLADRRKELEQRRKSIETREEVLLITEKRIDQKIGALRELRDEVANLLQAYKDRESEKISSLVKIYESMKPKAAAEILAELETDILLDVVYEMSERKVAPILANMDPVRAKQITSEYAEQKRIQKEIIID